MQLLWWRTDKGPGGLPQDSSDLALLMSLVTAVGGISALRLLNNKPGFIGGMTVSALFLAGGLQIMDSPLIGESQGASKRSHEMGHQLSLIGSLMFTGAMSYRAGSNPYSGPGGMMLAALGAVSALYHLDKMVEWRRWEEERIAAAERLLRTQQRVLEPHGGGGGRKQDEISLGKQ